MGLSPCLDIQTIFAFLEFLSQNHLSPKVISGYISSLRTMAAKFKIPHDLSHYSVSLFLRSLRLNAPFKPTPRGTFDLSTLAQISWACEILDDPLLFRAAFFTGFFAFLRASNLAPHSIHKFSKSYHLLRQDIIFAPPGGHVLIKWTKTLQDHKAHHLVQIPKLANLLLCPVTALQALLQSRPLPGDAPLFANKQPPNTTIIDTHLRDALKKVLHHIGLSPIGLGFHAFRRSVATLAFDNGIPLQDIMAHGLWRSSVVWTYLQNASQAASQIPTTFASIIPPHF